MGINYKRLGVILLAVICFWSLVFNFILFGYEQALINGNHNLERYLVDNNCGLFAKKVGWYLDANKPIDFNLFNKNELIDGE